MSDLNDKEKKELLDQLFNWIDHDLTTEAQGHTEKNTDESGDPPPFSATYTEAVHNEVVAFTARLKAQGIPFFLAVVRHVEVIDDPERGHGREFSLSSWSWMPEHICEFLAMNEIVRLPHQFTHWVLDLSEKVGLLEAFQQFLDGRRDDDQT